MSRTTSPSPVGREKASLYKYRVEQSVILLRDSETASTRSTLHKRKPLALVCIGGEDSNVQNKSGLVHSIQATLEIEAEKCQKIQSR